MMYYSKSEDKNRVIHKFNLCEQNIKNELDSESSSETRNIIQNEGQVIHVKHIKSD